MSTLELSSQSPSTPAILHRRLRLLAFLLVAMASGLPLGAQNPTGQGSPGFDFFHTNPKATRFKFAGDFAIPAGFFGEGSQRFVGTVAFKGVPLRTFREHKTGNADTVVERKATPALRPPYPSEGRTEIELAALSLESRQPIRVLVGKKTELWDVKVQPSSTHPSTGNMTLVQRSARGGTARSELTVYPLFTFVRRGEKAERTLDTGTLKLSPQAASQLTLKATLPWATKSPPKAVVVPGLSDQTFLSVRGTQPVESIEDGLLAAHGFTLAFN